MTRTIRTMIVVAAALAVPLGCVARRGGADRPDPRSRAWIGHDLADIEAVFGTDTTVDVEDGYLRVRVFHEARVRSVLPEPDPMPGPAVAGSSEGRLNPWSARESSRGRVSRTRRATFWLDEAGSIVKADVVADRPPPENCAHRARAE